MSRRRARSDVLLGLTGKCADSTRVIASAGWCYRTLMEVAPGAFHLRGALDVDEQREIFARCRFLMDGPVAAYVPVVRGGGKMHVRMLCLGRHWNGKTYRYEPIRSDFDGQPVPPIPDEFRALARRLAESVGMMLDPDVCIMNYYDAEGRMGLHQDKDESERSLAAGLPVVSVSIGDTARFLFGGTKRRDDAPAASSQVGARVRRRVRLRRSCAPALPRRVPHPARHRAAGARIRWAVQPDVQTVRPLSFMHGQCHATIDWIAFPFPSRVT